MFLGSFRSNHGNWAAGAHRNLRQPSERRSGSRRIRTPGAFCRVSVGPCSRLELSSTDPDSRGRRTCELCAALRRESGISREHGLLYHESINLTVLAAAATLLGAPKCSP